MPTADRPELAARAIEYWRRQDYPNRELVIVDDGARPVASLFPPDTRIRYVHLDQRARLGAKRNLACDLASGPLIAHWDDDDWYAPTHLSTLVHALLSGGREVCGSRQLLFFEPSTLRAWEYALPDPERAWLAGATLGYTKRLWQQLPFANVDSGEDGLFVASAGSVTALPTERTCVAMVHSRNASPKLVTDRGWRRVPTGTVLKLLGADTAFYRSPLFDQPRPRRTPLVSCITPTCDRRPFVRQAIKYFLAQEYPNRELILVDDGDDPVGDLVPSDARIRYVRLSERRSIGYKRNLACADARGEVLLQWDDDDWHGPERISYQVMDIITDTCDLTGLKQGLLLDLPTGRFLGCEPDVPAIMHPMSLAIHCATLAFTRDVWQRSGGYPDSSAGEDLVFYLRARDAGARIIPLENDGSFVYVRHRTNSWRFTPADFGGERAWRQVPAPPALTSEDLAFYLRLGRALAA